jgi:hypothetical protein
MRTPKVFQDDRDIQELTAGADLSALQDLAVKASATGVVAAGAGELAVGILRNAPAAAGLKALVQTTGVATINGEAAITANDPVQVGAAGGVVTAVAGFVLGVALETTAGAGDIQILLGNQTVV